MLCNHYLPVNPLASVILWWISGPGICTIGSVPPAPNQESALVNNRPTTSDVLHPQQGPWQCILLTLFPIIPPQSPLRPEKVLLMQLALCAR